MSDNNIQLSGIFSEGYGINPKKLWKMKIGEYVFEDSKEKETSLNGVKNAKILL